MATEVAAAAEMDAVRLEKIQWSNQMRQQFSPEGMCNEDGSINQDFFKPKRIIIQLTEDKKWGEPEKEALYKVRSRCNEEKRSPQLPQHPPADAPYPSNQPLPQGLEAYGVGKWREIITEYPELRRYDEQFIRIKAARLLGTQSLARHIGWKGNKAAVDAEREKHRQLGERLGCWKGGVLVEDNQGSVAKALAEAAAGGAQQ